LVSLDGVAPSRIVSVCASVNLPLHHKVQKFSSGTGLTGWSRKRAVKQLWCGVVMSVILSDDVIRVLVSFSSNYSLQPVEYAVSELAGFVQLWVRSKGTRHNFR